MSRAGYAQAVLVLLAVHAVLLLVSSRRNFVVLDEAGHIPSGLSHWELGDFSLYRVNPPLGRMLATLPLLATQPYVNFRGLDHAPGARGEFQQATLFAELNRPRYFDLVCLARLSGIIWSLLGAWLIYAWGRELYGPRAGLLGAALWCFDPTVLAFAPVVTPDIPAAVAALAATYAFWRFLRGGSWTTALVAGLLLGIAQLTKFTNLTLYGVWPLLWAVRRLDGRDQAAPRTRLVQLAAIFALSLYVINLGYGFQESGLRLGRFEFVSRLFTGIELPDDPPSLSEGPGNRFRDGWLDGVPVPVPAEYLRGIDLQRKDFEHGFPSYLSGQWRDRGWWYYYVYALAVKEPLGTIALVLWALTLTIVRHPASASRSDEAALLLPAAVVLVFVSSQTGFNHHMRYVLPVFPFVAVATGKLAWYFARGRRGLGLLVGALLIWSVGSSLMVHPHSMSYFNEAAGGPARGHRHLVDSNIDWGQDLLDLKRWLDRHPEAQPLGLAYFHFLDPTLFGIDYEVPPPGPDETTPRDPVGAARFGPHPGYHALSVHLLQGAKFNIPDGRGGTALINRHDYFAYFRLFRPIARAGYSVYIFHITPAQADAARRHLGLPPLPSDEVHSGR